VPQPAPGRWINNTAVVLKRKGDFDRAQEYLERAIKILTKVQGPDHPSVAHSHANLGNVFYSRGDYDQALEHLERALALYEKTLGTANVLLSWPLSGTGWIAFHRSDFGNAKALFERVLSICGIDKCKGDEQVPFADPQFGLAKILWRDSVNHERALQLAKDAMKLYTTESSVPGRKMFKEAEAWLRERGVEVNQ
jgi:eukaryotic-like serine/threonine-protein kinase